MRIPNTTVGSAPRSDTLCPYCGFVAVAVRTLAVARCSSPLKCATMATCSSSCKIGSLRGPRSGGPWSTWQTAFSTSLPQTSSTATSPHGVSSVRVRVFAWHTHAQTHTRTHAHTHTRIYIDCMASCRYLWVDGCAPFLHMHVRLRWWVQERPRGPGQGQDLRLRDVASSGL